MHEGKVVEVLQLEIGITSATDPRPVLATKNVAMCIAFHGFNIEKYAIDTISLSVRPYPQKKSTLSPIKLVRQSAPEFIYEPKSHIEQISELKTLNGNFTVGCFRSSHIIANHKFPLM